MSWYHSISAERNGVSDDENFGDVGEKSTIEYVRRELWLSCSMTFWDSGEKSP